MAAGAVMGATMTCSFGTIPSTLIVSSNMQVMAQGRPMATILDMATIANIPPFGLCSSMANPAVSAAGGIPKPCTMVPAGTWPPKAPKVMIGGKPCLTGDCQLHCALGQGQISILNPGQTKAIIK